MPPLRVACPKSFLCLIVGRTDPKRSRYTSETEDPGQDDVGNLSFLEQVVRGNNLVSVLSCADLLKQLAVLGYSCEFDGFVFNFTSSPTARRIISDFYCEQCQGRSNLLEFLELQVLMISDTTGLVCERRQRGHCTIYHSADAPGNRDQHGNARIRLRWTGSFRCGSVLD